MTAAAAGVWAAGLTLADGWAWAESCGAARFAVGSGAADGVPVMAPREALLTPAAVMRGLPRGRSRYALACGEQAAVPDMAALGEALTAVMQVAGVGFAALCLAAPGWVRTVYQGHLFAGARHMAGLAEAMRGALPGRAAVVGQEIVARGAGAITQRLHALRAADVSVALVDAIDEAGYRAVAAAFAGEIVVAGPAWLAPPGGGKALPPPAGPVAVLAGACDRETLYQLGAARAQNLGASRAQNLGASRAQALGASRAQNLGASRAGARFLQLNLTGDGVADAIAWAGAPGTSCIIASSAPPDRLAPGADAASALADVACSLAAAGWKHFVIAGNDTAAAILAALDITILARGAAAGGLRWWHGGGYSFLLKPGGFGGRDLFHDLMEPQIGLNPAAE